MRLIGRVTLFALATVGMLTVAMFVIVGAVAARHQQPSLPSQMVLMLDLDAGLTEVTPESPFARLESSGYSLEQVVSTLDRASRDPHVTGLVARIDDVHLGMAKAQEVRDAVAAFRKAGKRTVAYSTSFGEGGPGTSAYYTASAFQEIWLQPSGDVGLTGFMAESPFLKDVFEKVGIQPQFGARWEFKSAIETFTQNKFTKENHDSLNQLLTSWSGQVTQGIAEGRGLKPDEVKALIDRSPLLGDEAVKAHLVDKLAYWDEMQSSLTAKGNKVVDLADYSNRLTPEANAVKVALIYGVGTVQRGDGDKNPLSDDVAFSSERIGKAFRAAVKDPDVRAILFRIDSPGGSYTAADAVWREVVNARASGKPVIVSMGDVAASGGYFAAMPADRIIAQPGTITGSIGVFSGKFVMTELWKKLGVNWDEVHSGQNAGMWSANQPFSPAAWDRLNFMLDRIYADFTGKAGKARNITPEQMDKLARGRIWPGDLAQQVGLIDETGGYATAFADIRKLTRLPSQMPLDLEQFPRPREPLEELMEMMRTGHIPTDLSASIGVLHQLSKLQASLAPFQALIQADGKAELMMPPVKVQE